MRRNRSAIKGGLTAALMVTGICESFGQTAAASTPPDAKLVAYGKHLANECSACHRIDGVDNGIPSITGWDAEEFVATLVFYRNGERTNQAMVSVAQSMEEDQFKALAAYYATLPKGPRSKTEHRIPK